MRKHILAILLPILVVILVFIVFKSNEYSNTIRSENIDCHSNTWQQCLLEKRRKTFSQKWQMDNWRKINEF